MRDITMERVNETRVQILETIKNPVLTHEQKVTNMANLADSLLEVLDVPEGLDELLNAEGDEKCICDLFEGHAPVRPRYIVPDYAKFLKEGSEFYSFLHQRIYTRQVIVCLYSISMYHQLQIIRFIWDSWMNY